MLDKNTACTETARMSEIHRQPVLVQNSYQCERTLPPVIENDIGQPDVRRLHVQPFDSSVVVRSPLQATVIPRLHANTLAIILY